MTWGREFVMVLVSASLSWVFRTLNKKHLHNMTANFGKTCVPFKKRSVWAGCSGAFFFVPGLFGLNDDKSSHAMLFALVVQSVLSVMSDYVHTGHDSVWHGLDRWGAFLMMNAIIYMTYSALTPWHCLIGVPPLGCLHMSKSSAARGDWKGYVKWHTLWWALTQPALFMNFILSARNPPIRESSFLLKGDDMV